ncbi:MAG: hypothetical protein M3179_02825, partial [Actinomycetota bacterium]|nr:hypothetical protein [Actinomycetota bacterium]
MTRPTTGLQRRPTTPPPEAPAPTRRDPADLPVHAVLLIVALTAGVTGQGAYYAEGQRLMALLFAVALVFSLTVQPSSSITTWRGPRRVAAALAAWVVVSGAVTGHLAAAGSFVALIAGVLVVLVLCSRTAPRQREALAGAVVALGALVALAGWVGVAWRITPWALEDQALWRAASPLTYANATAGFLAAAALVALGRLVRAPGRPLEAVAVCLLLMGVGATLSRAGLLSLALGIAVLCAVLGLRRVVVGASGPVLGAAVALAGLAPSMPA